MRRMIAVTLLAGCLAGPGLAQESPPHVWVGSMILLDLNSKCGGGATSSVTIVYRPKLNAGEENSTLSYLFQQASGTARKVANSRQMNGTGAYDGTFVTGYATIRNNRGRYDLDIRPAEITPDTDFIRFDGTFTNFAGVDGCTATVRGTAARLQ